MLDSFSVPQLWLPTAKSPPEPAYGFFQADRCLGEFFMWQHLPQHIPASRIDSAAILDIGRRSLATEAEALWSLGHLLDDRFVAAVEIMRDTHGRIIVCGLGKSGHIARKAAATLMATGSPACFLHASEAVHGDLGMLTAGDTLLILSNSGDTREFGVIIRRAGALAVPIIAITSARESTVAAAARTCLLLPAKPEICPFGSSPTTSTTMMLGLTDALAIALMRCRGTGPDDLHCVHPGGRLGLDLTAVESFMHRGDALPLVRFDAPMKDVLELIGAKGFGVAGVIDAKRRLLGVITDGDVRRHATDLCSSTADAVMTTRPRTLMMGAMARDALAIFSEARITSLFVLRSDADGQVAGLVHIHDLLRLGIG